MYKSDAKSRLGESQRPDRHFSVTSPNARMFQVPISRFRSSTWWNRLIQRRP